MKINKLLTKPRILILIFFIIISILAINPTLNSEGAAIKNVEVNSTAFLAGIKDPLSDASPTSLEIIKSINNQPIVSLKEYGIILDSIPDNSTLTIETDQDSYFLRKESKDLGLSVVPAQSTNLRKGLDLSGGTRVLLTATEPITEQERDEIIQVMSNRLNTYGLSDIQIKKANDILGNKYILVELAEATEQDVAELVASQGVFEAKIGNDTIFTGGKEDVPFVCRSDGTCAGVTECNAHPTGAFCNFQFQIRLSDEAAERHADITKDLDVIPSQTGGRYLELPLDLYLDGELVDTLNIDESLKGTPTTSIVISGPGLGVDEEAALDDALQQMNKLQTILITGSLPTSLEIVKLDTISPILGEEFVRNAIITGLLAVLAVAIVIFIRYRKLRISIPVLIAISSEVLIILGLASLFKYNLDLAAIAGIIASVGTGVDDQIVILDEIKNKEHQENLKKKLKKAFFIIFAAYATTMAAMIPLLKAGAGLLTGFALATMAGISIGVFITRPAFATMVQFLLEDED
tara:strand:+ start:1948 stop:3510 length:1563 start_codon:yes stop_codon:yes gene_type:complete